MEPRVFAEKYVVDRELSEAHSGRTFLATAPGGSRVVVKVVHPVDGAAATAVERDVSLISGIRHPALPAVEEWGHEGADFFVVREYVPGVDLESELGQQGAFAPLTAARYAGAASDALAQIHSRGLVHGNVKTANLIRTPEDEIKLVGNSLGLAGPVLPAGAPASAAHYIAPEQAEGGAAVSPATDVYAMGVVLYELVTGRVPFDAPTAAEVADMHAHAVPEPVRAFEPDVPVALESVIMRALEKSPSARYADGAALGAALRAAFEPPKEVAAPVVAAPRKRAVWPWVVPIVALVVMIGVAWASGMFGTSEKLVPDVVGMTQAQASAAIQAANLQVGVVTYSGTTQPGVVNGAVFSQSPAKGAKVDPASKVDLMLVGPEPVTVPNIVGMSQTQATGVLQAAGLVIGAVSTVTTAGVTPGLILTQSPAAGGTVAKGTAVDVQVSLDTVAVPDVTGAKQADAESTLKAAGFLVSVVVKASATVASGRVIEQNPTGGVTAQTGSTVSIVVSNGPDQVAVPDVGTMTQTNAVNALTAAGFKAQIVLQTGGGPVGTVVAQNPLAGAKATSGSTVKITVVQ